MTLLRATLLAVLMVVVAGPQLSATWELPVNPHISACPLTQVPVTEFVTFTARDVVMETAVSEDIGYRFATTTSTSTIVTSKHVCETYTAQPIGPAPSVIKTLIAPYTISYRNLILTHTTMTITTTELDRRTRTSSITPTVTKPLIDTYFSSLLYTVVTYMQEDVVTIFTTTTKPTQVVTEAAFVTELVTRTNTVIDPVPVLITKFPTQFVTVPVTKTWHVTQTVCEPAAVAAVSW